MPSLVEPVAPLLTVRNLYSGYGRRVVVRDVSLDVKRKEIVALIGHNGSGKSTLLRSIYGILPISAGDIFIEGIPLAGVKPSDRQKHGIGYVPQGNRVFRGLTVRENLLMGAISIRNRRSVEHGLEYALAIFPSLRRLLGQRAGTLSGGEMQLVALAAGLVSLPRLMLLDEPSLGLATPLVHQALERIADLVNEQDLSVLIVEQKVRDVLRVSQRVYVLRNGHVSFSGPSAELFNDERLRQVYL